MLSVEIPPPDPSCSSQFQPLSSNSDERFSTIEPNPPNSDLNHRPNFSIRDYVFTARGRDITKSWPFSSKNLQLCLKHGVKELLPPFDKRCVIETSSLQKEKTVGDLNSGDTQLNYKLVESCFDISSCRSVNHNDFPSSTTTTSHSETKPLIKKCRLIVKFGGNSDRTSTEIMASNVCPVCKTFSSSSNTTLNAHIDQCLSVESTPRWTCDSKLKRQRIKPRKTRLMVDIYSTALPCTLEELDRRNGTTWAAGSCMPMQEIGERTGNEGKRMRVPQSHPKDNGDVGPVYVDSNGRKVRILSKSDDLPSLSKVTGDIEARKPSKGDKGVKYISKKKKNGLGQKHHEFQKLAPQSKMNFSLDNEGSQIVEEVCEGEANIFEEENRVRNQTKQSDSITLKPWVCSKRRGFAKKTSQEGCQPARSSCHLTRNLPAFNNGSFFGGTDLSEISASTAASPDKMEKSFLKVWVSKKEQSPVRKRTGKNSDFWPVRSTSVQVGNHGKRARSYTSRKIMIRRNGRSSVSKSVVGKFKKLSALKKKKRYVEGVSRKGEEYDLRHHNAEIQEDVADESLEMNTLHVSEQVEELAISTSQPDHCSQSAEDYKRFLFGTEAEALPAPNEVHFDCDLDTFSADLKSFPEVDPIPIPGPPGSFLPSPRDMGSDDLQGNSSLTTSRVHSSLDHHDVVDGPCAESSLRSVDTVPPKKNELPYCCQWKERLLNLPESELLRRRMMAAMAFPTGGNYNSNPISGDLDPKMILPAMKPFASPGASGSDSPSASSAVLRLMGKNLVVVNKDDATSFNTQISNVHNNNDSHSLTYRGSYPTVDHYYEGHSGSRLPVNAQLPTDYSFMAQKPVADGVPESENTAINKAVKGNTGLLRWGCASGFSHGFS